MPDRIPAVVEIHVIGPPGPPGSYLVVADGTVTSRPLDERFAEPRHIKDFGAIGDGIADDTAAFQLAADSGEIVALTPGRYRLTQRVDFTGGGLVGTRDCVILPDVDGFDNISVTPAGRYGTNAVVLSADGGLTTPFAPLEAITLRGFTIDYQALGTEDRYITAVVARNIRWLDIQDLEIKRFPGCGSGIRVASVAGRISKNYIHNLSGSNEYSGIEIDGDEPGAIPSHGLTVTENVIYQLNYNEAAYGITGFEPNAIKVVGQNSYDLNICANIISGCGQGIDTYSQNSRIADNILSYCLISGISLKHGASHNDVGNNVIMNSGLWGIVLIGDPAPHQTVFNNVHDNIVRTVGVSWVPFVDYSTQVNDEFGCIMTWPDHATTNNVITNNILVPGTGIVARSAAQIRKGFADQTNHWVSNFAYPGTLGIDFHENGELGVNTPLSTAPPAFVNTSPGAETVAFSAVNRSSGAGSGIIINLNPTANTDDSLRSVQLAAVNRVGGNTVDFEIRTPNGAPAVPYLVVKGDGKIVLPWLPTSAAGLTSGMLWNSAGTVKIV